MSALCLRRGGTILMACLTSFLVKPAAPKELKIHHVQKQDNVIVSWQYPDSWNNPHSYFPLLFKVDVELNSRRLKRRQISTQVQ